MRLEDLASDMADLLKRAAIWFRGYEANHRAKGTPDADIKAVTNSHRAEELENMVRRYEQLTNEDHPKLPLPPVSDGQSYDMFGWRSDKQ